MISSLKKFNCKYLIGILPLVTLISCTSLYQWKNRYDSVPVKNRFWTKTDKEYVLRRCPDNPNAVACAVYLGVMCDIYSIYSEEEAKRQIDGDGMTIFDHEYKHCDGWIHN